MFLKTFPRAARKFAEWLAIVVCLLLWTSTTNAVEFELLDLGGDRHRLSDFRGKWVVINFWATWCGPCLKEIPELITFQSRYRSEVVVVGVNFENTPLADVKEFVASSGINYLVLRIGKEPLIPFEPLKGLPSTFLVSPKAEYLDVVVGAVTVAELEDLIVQHRGRTAHSAETV